MTLVPEPPQPQGPEKSTSKGTEAKPIAEKQPIGPNEQGMIQRIDQDGDPDNILKDIAGEENLLRKLVGDL